MRADDPGVRPDLPTGTVTFLHRSSKAQGRSLSKLGAKAYSDALADQRAVIRELVLKRRRRGGHAGRLFLLRVPYCPWRPRRRFSTRTSTRTDRSACESESTRARPCSKRKGMSATMSTAPPHRRRGARAARCHLGNDGGLGLVRTDRPRRASVQGSPVHPSASSNSAAASSPH